MTERNDDAPGTPEDPRPDNREPDRSAESTDRPAPGDPLAEAEMALRRGDHRHARALARALAERTDDAAVRERARDFEARFHPDRMIVGVLVGTFALIAALALRYLPH